MRRWSPVRSAERFTGCATTSSPRRSPRSGWPSTLAERNRRSAERQAEPALTNAQVLRLVRLGRRIEAHFGRPQDIEWCLVDEDFQFVQSRPITTLFPVPATDDGDNHVYISVGHQQMMTDAMRPLGLSLWQLTTPRTMHEAGGRLFVDVAPHWPRRRVARSLLALAKADPLIRERAADRSSTAATSSARARTRAMAPGPAGGSGPAGGTSIEPTWCIVTDLIARSRASVATLQREIQPLSGPALLDFILADIAELKRILFDPRSHQAIMAGMEATWWLNDHLEEWLGEKNAADALTQSVPHNVTSEMGLALLDVADAIRPHPDVVAFLRQVVDDGPEDDGFLDELAGLAGGREARDAIRGYLDEYGMRCAGEIDITRTRWSERPVTLLPTILGNIKNFEPGAGQGDCSTGTPRVATEGRGAADASAGVGRRRAQGRGDQADDRPRPDLRRSSRIPEVRHGLPLLPLQASAAREAERLVRAGILRAKEDIFYLRFEELQDVVRTNQADDRLIQESREAFRSYQALTPPRVITSDGEAIAGSTGAATLRPAR